jgi:ornithine carbamoyltransferase
LVQKARDLANKNNAHLNITTDISEPVNGVDCIHTDGWVSMGEPTEVCDERINHLEVYRVNVQMIEMCGNPKCCAAKIHYYQQLNNCRSWAVGKTSRSTFAPNCTKV